MIWKLPNREITLPRRPLLMGIVNVNDDSFSGDGTLQTDAALAHAARQVAEGADIIDVGAESARTNRAAIPVEEEIRRFRGFLELWPETLDGIAPKDAGQVWPPVLSANTWRPETVEVLPSGTLALTSGPVFAPDGTLTNTFTSVWRLEPDGKWRVIFDKGCPVEK